MEPHHLLPSHQPITILNHLADRRASIADVFWIENAPSRPQFSGREVRLEISQACRTTDFCSSADPALEEGRDPRKQATLVPRSEFSICRILDQQQLAVKTVRTGSCDFETTTKTSEPSESEFCGLDRSRKHPRQL